MTITIQIDTHHDSMSEGLLEWLGENGSFVSSDGMPNMESETWNIPIGDIPIPVSRELCECAWVCGADGQPNQRFLEWVS